MAGDSPETEAERREDSASETVSPRLREEVTRAVNVVVRRVMREEYHSGPLPSAETVERYEGVLPGSFDRILTMAERSLEHEMACDQRALELEARALDQNYRVLDHNEQALKFGQAGCRKMPPVEVE